MNATNVLVECLMVCASQEFGPFLSSCRPTDMRVAWKSRAPITTGGVGGAIHPGLAPRYAPPAPEHMGLWL